MAKFIDAEKLKESFVTAGLFDIGELGVILPIIDEQPHINVSDDKTAGGAA